MVAYGIADTALGYVAVAGSDNGLLRVILPGINLDMVIRELLFCFDDEALVPTDSYNDILERLRCYARGERVAFEDCLLDWDQVSSFSKKVLEECRAIPYGQVCFYGELAERIGTPGTARAVGQALGSNPWPIIVPCHRVVGQSGRLTGYGGGLPLKARLLHLEGIECTGDRVSRLT